MTSAVALLYFHTDTKLCLRWTKNCHIPLQWPLAYTTTVQAVIYYKDQLQNKYGHFALMCYLYSVIFQTRSSFKCNISVQFILLPSWLNKLQITNVFLFSISANDTVFMAHQDASRTSCRHAKSHKITTRGWVNSPTMKSSREILNSKVCVIHSASWPFCYQWVDFTVGEQFGQSASWLVSELTFLISQLMCRRPSTLVSGIVCTEHPWTWVVLTLMQVMCTNH